VAVRTAAFIQESLLQSRRFVTCITPPALRRLTSICKKILPAGFLSDQAEAELCLAGHSCTLKISDILQAIQPRIRAIVPLALLTLHVAKAIKPGLPIDPPDCFSPPRNALPPIQIENGIAGHQRKFPRTV
jgi:hypothetical protein